jgi:hypothetical protein
MLGAAIIATAIYAPRLRPTGEGSTALGGLFVLLAVGLGLLFELPGILLTLTACLMSLWSTARGHPGRLVGLLTGALLPFLVTAAILVFLPAIGEMLPQIVPWDNGATLYFALLVGVGSAAAPIAAAITTTAYAAWAAWTAARDQDANARPDTLPTVEPRSLDPLHR